MQRNSEGQQPLLLTIPQVAKRLAVSRAMVYSLISRSGLPVIKLGRSVRVSVASWRRWVEEQENDQHSV